MALKSMEAPSPLQSLSKHSPHVHTTAEGERSSMLVGGLSRALAMVVVEESGDEEVSLCFVLIISNVEVDGK